MKKQNIKVVGRWHIIKVMMQGGKWIIKSSKIIDGWTVDDQNDSKSHAISKAFKYAKRFSPAKVRIYTAAGRFQVESLW